jgi:hypothetical protein
MRRAGFTLGCVECLDASPTYYRITHITAWGFTGRWINYHTGIGTYVDRRGRRLPDPEGFFCARRLAAQRVRKRNERGRAMAAGWMTYLPA